MSTLKTTYLQHPSAASANVTLASDGKTTVNGAMVGAGMDLINTTSFSGVSSVSLNNVFTSTYENYRIYINFDSNSSAGTIFIRMRAGGVDNTTTNYGSGGVYNIFTTNTASANGYGNAANYWGVHYMTSPSQQQRAIDIFSPAAAAVTSFGSIGSNLDAAAYYAGAFNAATQFDGFTVSPSAGTVNGRVRVYGLRNS